VLVDPVTTILRREISQCVTSSIPERDQLKSLERGKKLGAKWIQELFGAFTGNSGNQQNNKDETIVLAKGIRVDFSRV
jgi:hypothetical protein